MLSPYSFLEGWRKKHLFRPDFELPAEHKAQKSIPTSVTNWYYKLLHPKSLL